MLHHRVLFSALMMTPCAATAAGWMPERFSFTTQAQLEPTSGAETVAGGYPQTLHVHWALSPGWSLQPGLEFVNRSVTNGPWSPQVGGRVGLGLDFAQRYQSSAWALFQLGWRHDWLPLERGGQLGEMQTSGPLGSLSLGYDYWLSPRFALGALVHVDAQAPLFEATVLGGAELSGGFAHPLRVAIGAGLRLSWSTLPRAAPTRDVVRRELSYDSPPAQAIASVEESLGDARNYARLGRTVLVRRRLKNAIASLDAAKAWLAGEGDRPELYQVQGSHLSGPQVLLRLESLRREVIALTANDEGTGEAPAAVERAPGVPPAP